ncbi:MAG: hypothetical protein JSV64_06175 [Candidatus Bathyarchaeota archaeon]|nr:MAG: hypothetical protein JSV64_06175 [Candidatus Bathyarchaeota archaeon]
MTYYDDEVVERKLLLKRVFTRSTLLQIGKIMEIPYFNTIDNVWDLDYDKAALEIASNIESEQLKEIFRNHKPRTWAVFRGRHYTFEAGDLRLGGSWQEIEAAIAQTKQKFGENSVVILRRLAESGGGVSLEDIRSKLSSSVDPSPILSDLEELKVIVTSYKSKDFQEWTILEETSPIIRSKLGLATYTVDREVRDLVKVSAVDEEGRVIDRKDRELDYYLIDLLKHRVDSVVKFGKSFSISYLADYLRELFGPILFFDSLLSITQQYGLANVEITHQKGKTGMQTGWNLSLFGEPGTGKSFSIRDIILGKNDGKISPHGIPGRNRYAGGMTPARFIRIGQAYSGRIFNFVIPEFNDWFKYKGMVEPLKLAMERGVLKYETQREVVGPYRFSSFFSVNYNVAAFSRGYEVTIRDPNFNAIEDRMLCRLHKLTKARFIELAESQMRLAFGKIDVEEGAQLVRDHLTLVYAAETKHPLVKSRFPAKPIMLTPKAQKLLIRARKAILAEIPQRVIRFSARLEDRAIRFACAASLLSYFQSELDHIPLNDEALEYAVKLYVEEASVRSREQFLPESVLSKIPLN